MIRKSVLLVAVVAVLTACDNPKGHALPPSLEGLAKLQPQIDRLSKEDRELLGAYVARRSLASLATRGEEGATSNSLTIGQAIEEQKAYRERRLADREESEALQAEIKAKEAAAEAAMRAVVTVTLVSKARRVERGAAGGVLDEHLEVRFGYKNNAAKPISGVKGRIIINDQFGDEITAFTVSNDASIAPGATSTWAGERSLRYSQRKAADQRLLDLPDDKFVVLWKPSMVVFADGTKLAVPD